MNRWTIAVVGIAAAGAVAAGLALPVGKETAGHAASHLIPAAVVLLVAGLVLSRRPPTHTGSRLVAGGVLLLAAGQVAEAFGALGWDRWQMIERRRALTTLHDVALVVPAVALLVVAAGVALSVRRRLVRRTA